ncbi:NAD(P)/FAD-dependent oxidoreductase [Jiella avicenniae]|uniref:FAD-binding oxidoreductase n=1 Tax=Jiella avicenniae TaxID=2907202 RepID=A0A9X1NYM0_9HYPH|nr:FAD-dependent oxidoreductase [Jiella avicenniae]MCE7027110.1 FAD-binding oxidoreductase [Jiella avicenniae]
MAASTKGWPASLWRETARPRPSFGEAGGSQRADVVIVGGGYTGLSAAQRFVERGLRPLIVEANGIGWAASGRNGGVVSPKFRFAIPDIARRHGLGVARRMAELGHEAVEAVEAAVRRNGIADADLAMTGNLRCAHSSGAFDALKAEARTMREDFGDETIRILDRDEVAEETGSQDFVGGVLVSHAGLIHPLNYALGLAEGVCGRGVGIWEGAPATAIRHDGSEVVVETPVGAIRAKHVLFATNGYSDLTPGTAAIRRSVIPFRSAMVATGPLPEELRARLLRHGRSYSETRRMMRWFRPYRDRLIFGGRGAFGKTDSKAAFDALERAMQRVFPDMEGVPVTHRWSGLVAMTLDAVPQIGRLDDRIAFALGYNGAGIAMASLMGRYAADVTLGDRPDLALLGPRKLPNVPFYSLREPAVRLTAGWYQFLDTIGR